VGRVADSVKSRLDRVLRERDFFTPSTRRDRLRTRPLKTLTIALLTSLSRLTRGRVQPIIRAKTFWGDCLNVLLPEGSPVFLWGLIDGEELNLTLFLVDHLQPGAVFVDVGAHFGYYSLLAATLVGPAGSVHAFEPTPRTARILQTNVADVSNVVVYQQAAWSESGPVKLLDFGEHAGAFNTLLKPEDYPYRDILARHGRFATRIEVDAVSLNDWARTSHVLPDFIKVDVEGAELEVLLGATALLQMNPFLSVEIWRRSGEKHAEQLIHFLRGFSYQPHRLDRGRLVPYRFMDDFDFANLIFVPS